MELRGRGEDEQKEDEDEDEQEEEKKEKEKGKEEEKLRQKSNNPNLKGEEKHAWLPFETNGILTSLVEYLFLACGDAQRGTPAW